MRRIGSALHLIIHGPFAQQVGIHAVLERHARQRYAKLQACLDQPAFRLKVIAPPAITRVPVTVRLNSESFDSSCTGVRSFNSVRYVRRNSCLPPSCDQIQFVLLDHAQGHFPQ